jgi:hypothetical protein
MPELVLTAPARFSALEVHYPWCLSVGRATGPAIASTPSYPTRLRLGDSEHRFPTYPPRHTVCGERAPSSACDAMSTGLTCRPLRSCACGFLTIVIPLIVFLSLQGYFVRGLVAGSVKG